MKKIILISGKAQHGKDTFSEILKEELEKKGQRICITRYAKHIKTILKDYYGWDGETKDEYWRKMLQYLGTDKIRMQMCKPFFHVQRICEDIEITSEDFDFYIIPDCRFHNEIHYARAYFPRKIVDFRVHRPNFDNGLTSEQKLHPSEVDLDDFDFTHMINNVTLDNLKYLANKHVRRLLDE